MLLYEYGCKESNSEPLYGINVFENGILVYSIEEITGSRSDILRLTNLCNELNIELCHLDDIVEDYLTDFCI